MKKITAVLLILVQLLALAACGGGTTETTAAGTDTTADTTPAETESTYPYPETGYSGYEFTMFNADKQFGCNIRFDMAEQTGEMLEDAIYDRNRMVEEKMDIKLTEFQFDGSSTWGTSQQNMCLEVQRAVLAGDDVYDAAYLPVFYNAGIITDGTLLDLKTIPELQLDEAWWDQVINGELLINDKLYTASGPLNFMTMDLAWIMLFNENLMEDMGLEAPYDLVREGKWTLDAFNGMVSGIANLNGDASFTWKSDGNAFYAIANHTDSPIAFIYSAGNRMMERDGNAFKLVAGTERMYTTIDKLAVILNAKSGNVYSDNGSDLSLGKGYFYAFSTKRSLFMTGELKSTLELREMDDTFGLIPMPKFDEAQEDYMTYVNHICCFLTIPTTNSDLARTGTILDALTYESHKSILDIYYDYTLTHKGLRNEESVEMMDIIRNTRGTQVSNVLAISGDLNNKLASNAVLNASGTAASTIASAEPSIQTKLTEMMEAFK